MADDDRTGMIQVDLSDVEVEKRSQKLAVEELDREKLLEKKRTHNREWNEQLRQSRERIGQLATEVNTRKAWVPAQEDMFGEAAGEPDETPDEDETPAAGRRRRRRSEPPQVDAAS